MRIDPCAIAEPADPLDVEGQVRPEDARLVEILDRHLGLSHLQPATRQAVLNTVCRGLQRIEGPEALAWRGRLDTIAKSQQWPAAPNAPSPHALSRVLAEQPWVGLPRIQQDQCCAMGARAFIVAGFQLRALPKDFAHGLAQLFRNKNAPWCGLREKLVAGELDPAADLGNDAAERFRQQLKRLVATSLARPTKEAGAQPMDAPVRDELEVAEDAKPTNKELDDISPAWDLFERQVQRYMQSDHVDGNRLPIHWNRLTVREVKRVLNRIKKGFDAYAKHPAQFRRAIYAAMRLLSFHACIPVRACFRLPLSEGGDMQLDLSRGGIVRDWSRAVPNRIRPAHMERRIEVLTPLEDMTLTVLRELAARHPHAKTVGELVQAEGVTLRMIGQALNTDWPTSHRPEDARFAASWPLVLLEVGVHPAIAARLTGDTMRTPITDQVYTAIHDDDIDAAMRASCEWFELSCAEMPHPREMRGSAKYRPIGQLRALAERLGSKVEEARRKITSRSSLVEVIGFHNLYTVAVALCIEWMHATRCSKPERRTVEALIGSEDYLCVSDKKTDLYGQVRILPKTDVCRNILNGLCEHLVSMTGWLTRRDHPTAKQFERLSSGRLPHSPLFLLLETSGPDSRGYRNLLRKDVAQLFLEVAAECGLQVDQDDLNCFRHFFYSELVHRNTWQVAMDSLLGHHTVGAEPHGSFAGASVRELADYTRPILATLQKDLGFAGLAGLGRTYGRYMRPPDLVLDRQMDVLPNQYLLRKIREDEQVVTDFFARQQDPPAAMQTLRLHALADALKNGYLHCNAVAKYPAGGVLFCLILFDGVLAPSELHALYEALTAAPPYRIGAHAIAQAEQDGVVYVQRSPSTDTVAAWALLDRGGVSVAWEAAVEQLHALVRELRRPWPGTTAAETLTLIIRTASHWAAIEIAPGSMFPAHHKAPLVPAHHLARIKYQRPCAVDPLAADVQPERMLLPYTMFSAPLDVIHKWAKPEENLGGIETRREKCREELLGLLDDASRDFYERALIGQLAADLSDEAPYRQLAVSTIAQRIGKYAHVYGIFQRENTFDLDWECFTELMEEFGGIEAVSQSDTARWVLLHVGAYLTSRGHAHCLGGVSQGALKFTLPARSPVYVSAHEIAQVCARLPEGLLDMHASFMLAPTRLRIERAVPSRHSDIKYMRACDFDEEAALVHFTGSGHAHLKGGKHGSWAIAEELLPQLFELKRHKTEMSARKETLLFADSHEAEPYKGFDTVTRATRLEIVAVTGCPDFRRHDLRAAALTDICLGGRIEEMLRAPWRAAAAPVSVEALEQKHLRFYLAQRAARHSSAHTVVRHYNVGGVLDQRREFDLADQHRVRGPCYLSAVMEGALRGRTAENYSAWMDSLHARLPVPRLGSPPPAADALGAAAPQPATAGLLHAAVLHAVGASSLSIAAATQLAPRVVTQAVARIEAVLSGLRLRRQHRASVRVFAREDRKKAAPDRYQIAKRYANWLADPKRTPRLKRLAPVLLAAADTDAQALRFLREDDLLEFLGAIDGLAATGIAAFLCACPKDSAARAAAAQAGVACVDEFASTPHMTLRFLARDHRAGARTSLERVSPRTLGVDGRMAVVGLIAALTF